MPTKLNLSLLRKRRAPIAPVGCKYFAKRGVRYCFYLLPDAQTGNRRAVAQLAQEAALLVTDDFPAFVVPAHNRAIVKQVDCPVYAVDANSVVPLREMKHEEYAARTIRPKIHLKSFGQDH
jgi:deoxyribodipyrimidine photo-lyase